MIIHEVRISWASQSLILTNQRVIYWENRACLILSDLHIGKAAHFRKNGIAIPTQIHESDLKRFVGLLEHYKPKMVIIVGDLVHAHENIEVNDLKEVINIFYNIEFILIKGNHDRISKTKFLSWGFKLVDLNYVLDEIKFIHEPVDTSGFQIVGHIHPGVFIRLPTKKKFKMPAYVVNDKQIILPAFSEFTGLDTKSIFPNSTYYGIYKEGIVTISQY